MPTLLRCPFCGTVPRRVEFFDDDYGDKWAVECDGCGIRGPERPAEPEAAEAWNKRVPVLT